MQGVLNEKNDGILKSIAGTLTQVGKDYSKLKKNQDSTYLSGSISKYAKDLIMTFPMLCDDTLSIETAQMISKASERNIVNLLQLMFSSMSISGGNGVEVLKRFHNNIEDMSMDDVIDTLSSYGESVKETAVNRAKQRDVLKEMTNELKKPQKIFPAESLNEKSLLNYQVRNMYGKMKVMDRAVPFNEAVNEDPSITAAREEREKKKMEYEENRDKREDEKLQLSKGSEEYKRRRDAEIDYNNLNQKSILDNDIKKSNELQPTLMIVNIHTLDDNGQVADRVTFMAGVKSRLIAASAMDIVERLVSKSKTKLSFKNLLRATSGEINFFSDFLFCIKQAKINAKNAVKKGEAAKMWNTLEARSTKNAKRKLERSGNDASAITTLVINMETANYLKNAFNIDITQVKAALSMMEEYNLLALVIADEANEVASFLYDGNNAFDMVAYSSLSREASDKSYKKVVDLINKAGR